MSIQYEKAFTDALQFMWGKGFLSPGGPEEVREMLANRDVRGKRVLDIGAGLGGIDLLLVAEHGAAQVVGIDVESQLVDAAREAVADAGLADRIRFELVEPGPLRFEDASFDVVFSKDAMVHIPDKAALYAEVLRVLQPRGSFIAADWLWAAGAATSKIVHAWLSEGPLKFAFTTVPEAEAALHAAGFEDVTIVDCRSALQASNRLEIATLEGPARLRLGELVGAELAGYRLEAAQGRQAALDSGDLIPCHCFGRKAAS